MNYKDICMDLLGELECLVAAAEAARESDYAPADLQRMERMLKEALDTVNKHDYLWWKK